MGSVLRDLNSKSLPHQVVKSLLCFAKERLLVLNKQLQSMMFTNSTNMTKTPSLTLYHTILTYNNPKKGGFLKTFWKREKVLVTSIFSFSQNVFCPSETNFNFKVKFILLSAKAFNLDLSKILSFGKELIFHLSRVSTIPDIGKVGVLG